MSTLLSFLGVSLLVIVTPGQDTALTIRNTLTGGRRNGVRTAVGVSAGQAVWAAATSAGLAAVLVASEPVFHALRLLGAVYLLWLGLHALRDAFRRRPGSESQCPSATSSQPAAIALRQGFVSNLGNPKMALFFTSLLPQFAGGEHASFASLLALGLLFAALTLGWLAAYATAVARAGDLLRRPAVRRVLDAVTGTVLVAFGLRLATERR